ncbi:hypothetical protein MCHI_003770 [Candidatus Magnetoovum chiemensis]|nr:hypothetical protein MCHI_003770 [Candidatus Magnetoovum chiemensis]
MKKTAVIIFDKTNPKVYIFKKTKTSAHTLIESIDFNIENDNSHNLKDKSMNADAVYLSLPLDMLDFRVIRMPFKEKDKILATIPYELQTMTVKPVDAYVFDCLVLKEIEHTSYEIITAYIENTIVNSITESLNRLNLNPQAIISVELAYALHNRQIDSLLDKIDIREDEIIKELQKELKTPTINLKKAEPVLKKKLKEAKSALNITITFICLTVLITGAYSSISIKLMNERITQINTNMAQQYKEIFALKTNAANPLYQLKAKIKEQKDEADFFNNSQAADLLKNLIILRDTKITIDDTELSLQKILLRGHADSMADIEDGKDKLGEMLSNVKILETKSGQDNKVYFSINGNIK